MLKINKLIQASKEEKHKTKRSKWTEIIKAVKRKQKTKNKVKMKQNSRSKQNKNTSNMQIYKQNSMCSWNSC